jgi:hypothetical protein
MGFGCGVEGWRRRFTSTRQEYSSLETGYPERWPELVISEYGLKCWRTIIYGRPGAAKYPTANKSAWGRWLLATSGRCCRPIKVSIFYCCYTGSFEVSFGQSESYWATATLCRKAFWPWSEISVSEWELFEGEYRPTVGYDINTSDYILNWNV